MKRKKKNTLQDYYKHLVRSYFKEVSFEVGMDRIVVMPARDYIMHYVRYELVFNMLACMFRR